MRLKATPELNQALAKSHHWQSEVYENAESALIRAKGLADFLAHAAIYIDRHDSICPKNLHALAESISNEIQAVSMMMLELSLATGEGAL